MEVLDPRERLERVQLTARERAAYEGDVAAYWTLVVDGEPTPMRTPFDVDRAVRETSSSGWPYAQEFVAENLLQAVAREEAVASLESRR